MEKKPIKEVSADARLLYQRLAKMEVGDFVSYKELREIIGRDVQNEARGYLNTARLMCEREESKTFGVIINEGLKCLNGSEIVNTAAPVHRRPVGSGQRRKDQIERLRLDPRRDGDDGETEKHPEDRGQGAGNPGTASVCQDLGCI